MTDDERTEGADTDAGKQVQDRAPGPADRPGGTLGRDEGEGAPSPGEPGNVEQAQGGGDAGR